MKTFAIKQPINDFAKQQKKGDKEGRSRSISPLSTGMPLLQRQCACGGGCPRCQDELGIQTKLKISEPGDRYEQEADRTADEVMRMPELTIQRQAEPEAAERQTVPTQCVVNPGGSHLPPMGTVHPLPPGTPLRPCHLTEAQVRSSGNWCSDNHPHSGERCYRRIPTRSGLIDCPPGDQYCFTPDGCCHSSPDIHSPVNEISPPVPGLCTDHGFCATQHFRVDYLPSKIRRLRQQAEEEMRRRRDQLRERLPPLPF